MSAANQPILLSTKLSFRTRVLTSYLPTLTKLHCNLLPISVAPSSPPTSLSSFNTLRTLRQNAESLCARNVEFLHYASLFPANPGIQPQFLFFFQNHWILWMAICLHLLLLWFSFSRLLALLWSFSFLSRDHFRQAVFFFLYIFFRQDFSHFELFTSYFSLLVFYSDCARINIYSKNFLPVSFFDI